MASVTSSPHDVNQQPPLGQAMDFDLGDFTLPSSLDDFSMFSSSDSPQITKTNMNSHQKSLHQPQRSAPSSLGQPSPSSSSARPTSQMQTSTTMNNAASFPGAPQHVQFATSDMSEGPGSSAASMQQFFSAMGDSPASRSSSSGQHQPQPQQPQHQNFSAPSQQQGVNLSLSDLQRLIVEKEQSDRMQNLQTALLKQQLEILQRAQQNPQVVQQLPVQQQKDLQGSQSSVQQLLAMLQTGQSPLQAQTATTNEASNSHGQLTQDAQQLLLSLMDSGSQQESDPYQGLPKLLSDTSVLAQYGLITPPASGALNMGGPSKPSQRLSTSSSVQPFMSPLRIPTGSQPGPASAPPPNDGRAWDPAMRTPYTPLESPAITPASVFSNMSLNGMPPPDQFFSPLTSPALRPQTNGYYAVPPMGLGKPMKKSTTPTASPMALTGKPGPLPRKNRSTTAEARANRNRPSPMIKPSTGSKRKKEDEASTQAGTSASTSRPANAGDSSAPHTRNNSQTMDATHVGTFTPLMAGVAKPMDASPSEGVASTPSPIDLGSVTMPPPDATAPLTPGSIMGISRDNSKGEGITLKQAGRSRSNSSRGSSAISMAPGAQPLSTGPGSKTNGVSKSKGRASQVTFAANAKGNQEDEDEDEDGNAPEEGIGGPDNRRSSHKAAEQKRRDSLKFCFDELRGMLPPITLDEDAPGGSSLGPDGLTEDEDAEGFDRREVMDPEFSKTANRAISKVALLRHSNEWIVRLRNRLARRDAALAGLRLEVEQLRAMLLANGVMPPQMPPPGYAIQHMPGPHQLLPLHHHYFGGGSGSSGESESQNTHSLHLDAQNSQQQQQQQQQQAMLTGLAPVMEWNQQA